MITENQSSVTGGILADYLTPKELAAQLGVSERALSRWHTTRQGPPRLTIGRKLYYRRSSVEKWVAERERGFDDEKRGKAAGRLARNRHTYAE